MLLLTFVVWLSCVVWLQSFNPLDSLYPSAGHPADPASVIVWKRPLRSPMPGNARQSKFASGQNYWEFNLRCSKASQRYSKTTYLKNIDKTSNLIFFQKTRLGSFSDQVHFVLESAPTSSQKTIPQFTHIIPPLNGKRHHSTMSNIFLV